MEWINLSVTELDCPHYRRSEMADRGVWLTLLRYCVQQENHGRIIAAKTWTEWDCQQVLGIPSSMLEGTHHLWSYESGDLLVLGYPVAKQREIEAKRKASRKGNRTRWNSESHSDSHSDSQTASHSDSVSDSRKEGEREGERKGKGNDKAVGIAPASRRDRVGVLPSEQNEDLQQRMLTINACKNRKPDTRWNPKEWAAFKAAGLDTCSTETFSDQANQVTAYYRATIAQLRPLWNTKGDEDFRRRDLLTLLGNWSSEVDRAQAYCDFQSKIDVSRESGRL